MPPPQPEVSVVVPCHGGAQTLPALLQALQSQTLAPERFEVLIADPGADGTTRVLEDVRGNGHGLPLRVLRAPLAGGPAAKRNAGAASARGGLLAFTDVDCLPEPEWLEAGIAAARAGSEVVQGRTLPPEDAHSDRTAHELTIDHDSGLHETCNIFYARERFLSLGGFTTRYYERYGVPFGEDAELGWRARRAGAAFRFEPAAVVRHPVSGGLGAHLREQWLARGFPALVRDVPELRETLLHRRYFLSPRSLAAAAALAGLLAAPRRPLAALAAVPYTRALSEEIPPRSAGPAERARLVAGRLASDGTLLAALAWGSLRARSLVL